MSTDETTIVVAKSKPVKKLKPARKQETPQTGKEYNIWYNKWAGGDREDNYSNKVKSQTRCNIKKDSGLTRANTTGIRYCFCSLLCDYLHTLPDPDNALPDSSKDCFARDKFSDYRDDMGGVGSFNRQNRTLYVGRIKETGPGPETEDIVTRHFKEWGEIERIRVLQYRSVAFVTYRPWRANLDNDEILNVRWATEDPNPVQKVAEKRRLEEIGQEAIKARMDPRIVDAMGLDDEGEVVEDQESGETGDPKPKRRRIELPPPQEATSEPPPQPLGLSADTMEGLKYFAEIRRRNGVSLAVVSPKTIPPKPLISGLGVADYGSDEED
ncbi:hypothetical protein DFJ58DRAFT_821341 [Suillus subalutaceus]|uniref:uncharacterized protein n=1 Tax=Suillus subalutaceus TaxID=48586 RepID=UPI001B86BB1D|nr:uncharacterized protein DFJ58DRAFT_821341 [Suillus subalutaceus]KAG1834648.1 hypothetical protein DFJ58DRAFT_821341 [Suillus subalutaceus]